MAGYGSFTLNDGTEMPAIAFGSGSVWKGTDPTEYVEQALESGFSHIDTAAIYQTEEFVAKAIKESGLSRSDLYITTKYDGGNIREEMEKSLNKLNLKQVDLYLIHAMNFIENGDIEKAWPEFERIKEDGLAKSIGVSNFSLEQLQDLVRIAKIKPAVNQIKLHPYNWSQMLPLIDFSTKHGIVTEAYSSLTPITQTPGGPIDPVLNTIAKRIGGTPAQVIFSWLNSRGIAIVTTSSKKERLQEYLTVPDLPKLTLAELEAIEEAGTKGTIMYSFSISQHRLWSSIALLLICVLCTLFFMTY